MAVSQGGSQLVNRVASRPRLSFLLIWFALFVWLAPSALALQFRVSPDAEGGKRVYRVSVDAQKSSELKGLFLVIQTSSASCRKGIGTYRQLKLGPIQQPSKKLSSRLAIVTVTKNLRSICLFDTRAGRPFFLDKKTRVTSSVTNVWALVAGGACCLAVPFIAFFILRHKRHNHVQLPEPSFKEESGALPESKTAGISSGNNRRYRRDNRDFHQLYKDSEKGRKGEMRIAKLLSVLESDSCVDFVSGVMVPKLGDIDFVLRTFTAPYGQGKQSAMFIIEVKTSRRHSSHVDQVARLASEARRRGVWPTIDIYPIVVYVRVDNQSADAFKDSGNQPVSVESRCFSEQPVTQVSEEQLLEFIREATNLVAR